MENVLKSDTKQIRLWLSNELYAAIAEQKFAEKNVEDDLRDYALILLEEGLKSRKKQHESSASVFFGEKVK